MRARAAADVGAVGGDVEKALVELEVLLAARRVTRPLVDARQARPPVRVAAEQTDSPCLACI